MKHIIIGTAGHIDHGKTSLIRALTGRETDRLKEEQDRGITIELGFTWFDLKDGTRCGVIDVPGHEKFIQQMVSGVCGMDMVLLVVAADEGIMPQTREHLDILSLLGIENCIVVLTKCDLVDEDWISMVKEDIREEFRGTMLEKAEIVEVSTKTGAGIDGCKDAIMEMVKTLPEKSPSGLPRLPIDRVFSLQGLGTIVTGTLISGTLTKGDAVEIYPKRLPVRIRNIQVHEQDAEQAVAGQRVALNLTGLKKGDIKKGAVLARENSFENTRLLDAKVRILPSSQRTIKNRERLHFLTGTTELLCRIILLDKEELEAGEEGYCQILLEQDMVFAKGDPFLLRFYSPVETIGGGTVLEANAKKKKRFREEEIDALRRKEEGSLEETLETYFLEAKFGASLKEAGKDLSSENEELLPLVEELCVNGKLYELPLQQGTVYLHGDNKIYWETKCKEELEKFRKAHPYRIGMAKAELREKLWKKGNAKVFDALLTLLPELQSKGDLLYLSTQEDFKDANYQGIEKSILTTLENAGYQLLKLEELERGKAKEEDFQDILQNIVVEGRVVKVGEDPELLILSQDLEKVKAWVLEYFQKEEVLGIATLKDAFSTSRKCAKAMIQYFDREKITKKVSGESERVAGSAAK
ncbi:selenocysteine-specific translation elongation factor [Oribacterium sp.]